MADRLAAVNAPSTVRYSRRWRTGLSKLMPIIDSITIWWLSPMPRHSRPPVTAFTVSACWASIIGWRGNVGTTLVPTSMRGTSRPTMARAVRASWPKIWGDQNVSNPSASACRASATMSSTLPSFTVMLKIPVRMGAHSTGRPSGDRSVQARATRSSQPGLK